MTHRAVMMYEMTIPLASLNKLSDEERFSYYLLGHMFNELMSLQKLICFALPKHDDERPARRKPEIAQAMFLFRLASAKMWEAVNTIRKNKQLASTLIGVVLPRMAGGKQRLKELNAAVNEAGWLADLRNGIGFHFPSFDAWKSHVVPDSNWIDDSVYLGDRTGNTFYDAADSVGQAWMFSQTGESDVRAAVEPMIDQMISLLRVVNTFLEDALGTFIGDVILEGQGTLKEVGKVLCPEFAKVELPFWTAMPKI